MPEDEIATVLVNPKIVRRQGEREIGEGCLSLEGYQGVVTRSSKVRVRATGLDGKEIRIKAADDLLAQALEHEIDHLDGVLVRRPSRLRGRAGETRGAGSGRPGR